MNREHSSRTAWWILGGGFVVALIAVGYLLQRTSTSKSAQHRICQLAVGDEFQYAIQHHTTYATQPKDREDPDKSALGYTLEGTLRMSVAQANQTTSIVAAELRSPSIRVHADPGGKPLVTAQALSTPFAFILSSDCTLSMFSASSFSSPEASQVMASVLNHLQMWSPPHPDARKWARVFGDHRGQYQALFKLKAPGLLTRTKVRYMALHSGVEATSVQLKGTAELRWDQRWLVSVNGREQFTSRNSAVNHEERFSAVREPASGEGPKLKADLKWHPLKTPIRGTEAQRGR